MTNRMCFVNATAQSVSTKVKPQPLLQISTMRKVLQGTNKIDVRSPIFVDLGFSNVHLV